MADVLMRGEIGIEMRVVMVHISLGHDGFGRYSG